MGRGSASYERELKELLQGDPEALRRYARALPPERRDQVDNPASCPFLVVRAAGSLGFDLVALRREFAFPIEVKASASDTIRFSAASGRAGEQLEAHRAAVARVGLMVLYAYRRVGQRGGDPWRLFAPPSLPVRGSLNLLRTKLPEVDRTKDGNAVLRWNDGMPLLEFLALIRFLTTRSPAAGA